MVTNRPAFAFSHDAHGDFRAYYERVQFDQKQSEDIVLGVSAPIANCADGIVELQELSNQQTDELIGELRDVDETLQIGFIAQVRMLQRISGDIRAVAGQLTKTNKTLQSINESIVDGFQTLSAQLLGVSRQGL